MEAAGSGGMSFWGGPTQQSRQPCPKTGGFASSPQQCVPSDESSIIGAVGLEVKTREKPGKSPQFDHGRIRPRPFAFSNFVGRCSPRSREPRQQGVL
jgi:hypothetical protein